MKKITLLVFSMMLLAGTSVFAQGDDQSFQGFDLQGYNDDGGKAWDVKGDTADVMGSDIRINNVDANSYDDEGLQQINVTADTGMINQASGNMHLEDDVIITSEDGAQLMTDSLDWSRDDDTVNTEDDVFISDDGLTLAGRGMEAHPGLKNAEIRKNVQVTVDPRAHGSDAEKVIITSDGPMTIDQSKGVATFIDNVVAVQTDRVLQADKMEIYFDEEMNGVREMICLGNVVLTQGENQSYANKAVYNAIEKRLVLSGSPKLIMITEGEGSIKEFSE